MRLSRAQQRQLPHRLRPAVLLTLQRVEVHESLVAPGTRQEDHRVIAYQSQPAHRPSMLTTAFGEGKAPRITVVGVK